MTTIDVKSIIQHVMNMSSEEAKKHVIDMFIREQQRKQKLKNSQRKYRKSEKGKLAARRTYLKNYIATCKPLRRPFKSASRNPDHYFRRQRKTDV